MSEGVYMAKRETERLKSFIMVRDGRLSKREAAVQLHLSYRQFLRAYANWEEFGDATLPHKSRGKPSNHQTPNILEAKTKELMTLPLYQGFKPTFMSEKLLERHNIKISKETVRQWMIQEELWKAKQIKGKSPVHQRRLCRARCGELLQIDGSPHAWFEDRGDRCTLIIFVDDATGRTYGKFFPQETTQAYFEVLYEYIVAYGRPLTLYPDKFSVFRINRPGCLQKDLITQFGRVCKELGIELICANSAQAKGRVERKNLTLQDRLVKELRLNGINNIEDGNKFLIDIYWKNHNEKFCVLPRSLIDAHRTNSDSKNLKDVICFKDVRTVSKNLEFQYENEIFQIHSDKKRLFANSKVNVITRIDGTVSVEKDGRFYEFSILSHQEVVGKEVNYKELETRSQYRKKTDVDRKHPWKSKRTKPLCL